jgi:hypothetical protein
VCWNLELKPDTVSKERRIEMTPRPHFPTSENAIHVAPPPYSDSESNVATHIDVNASTQSRINHTHCSHRHTAQQQQLDGTLGMQRKRHTHHQSTVL